MNRKSFAIIAIQLAVVLPISAQQVQSTGTIHHEYSDKIDQRTNIASLGDDLFGDSTNFENGATTFTATDVKASSNVKIPVQLGRSLSVVTGKGGWGSHVKYNATPDIFGYRWDTEAPYMQGNFTAQYGWASRWSNNARCSDGSFSIAGGNVSSIVVPAHNFHYGIDVKIPGYGKERMLKLRTDGNRPLDGSNYVGTTKSHWKVQCLNTIKNGDDQGFVVTLPDGAKYYFDWIATSDIGYLSTDRGYLNLVQVRIYATKAVDRFGGVVEYTYDANHPHRIKSIIANDGASIFVNYNNENGKVSTISTNGRVWNYEYSILSAPQREFDNLVSVKMPDASTWKYSAPPNLVSPLIGPNLPQGSCEITVGSRSSDQNPSQYDSSNFQITHPSGAIGNFTFRPIMFGYQRTPGSCVIGSSYIPKAYISNSLYRKSVTGPGITEKIWSIKYYPKWSYASECQSCSTTANTIVSENSGKSITYVFGNNWPSNAGQLLSRTITLGVTKTEDYQYLEDMTGQPFPEIIGEDPTQILNNPLMLKNRPLKSLKISQDGMIFSNTINEYDSFVRPVNATKSNSLGHTKTDVTEYQDDLTKWVLSQHRRSTTNGIETTRIEYTANVQPYRNYAFGKLQQTLTYYADGFLATAADGAGNTTTLSSWKRGIPQLIQHPATQDQPSGTSQSAVVDDNGWIGSVTDENGYVTSYGYDALGRLTNIAYPNEPGLAYHSTTFSFYQLTPAHWKPGGVSDGQWVQVQQTGNHAISTYYDTMWRPVLRHEQDYANAATLRTVKTEYDLEGRVAFQSYPTGEIVPTQGGTYTSYDALGRVTQVKQDSEHGQLTTITEYLTGFQTRVTNPRGFQILTSYQAYDQPSYDQPTLISELGGDRYTEINRDVFGAVTALLRRNGSGSQSVGRYYVYDGAHQLCKTIEPETGAMVMDYDNAGNLSWQAAGMQGYTGLGDCNRVAGLGSGRAVHRTYDPRNRLKTLVFPDGRGNQTWNYTPDGLPSQIATDNDGSGQGTVFNAYAYNKRRLLAGESKTQPGFYTWGLGYGYTANGHLANQSYPTGLVVNYAPNALGQPTAAIGNDGRTYASGVQYHPNGAISQFAYGNGIVHTMTQNARQLPLQVRSGSATGYEYWYDENGNPTHLHDLVQGGNYSQLNYYDGLDRLQSSGSVSYGGDHWHRFTYDALDNLKSWKLGGVKDYANYHYEPNTNRLTLIENTAGAGLVGLGYDPQGNLSNKNGQGYLFDYGNRLRAATGKETYLYDGHGRREQTTTASGANTLWYYGQSGQMLFTSDWDGPGYVNHKTHEYVYLAGSLIATVDHSWPSNAVLAVKYQHTDALGSPVAVTNEAGAVIDRTQWEPYGSAIGKPAYNGIGYTGHVMDGATGLTYMQQRYMDSAIGRFLSVDPVTAHSIPGANFNRYWYANNNPYRFIDPDGRIGILGMPSGMYMGMATGMSMNTTASSSMIQKIKEVANQMPSPESKTEARAYIRPDLTSTSVTTEGCTERSCDFSRAEVRQGGVAVHLHNIVDGSKTGKVSREFPGPGDQNIVLEGSVNAIKTPSGAIRLVERIFGVIMLRTIQGNNSALNNHVESKWKPFMTDSQINAAARSYRGRYP